MKFITSPLKLNDTGSSVKDLQNALLSIAMKMGEAKFGKLLKDPRFLKNLTIEFNTSTYGEATEEAVKFFQKEQMGGKSTGKVNKATAAAINGLLGNGGQKASGSAAPVKESEAVPKG